mgnify:CR=1 FL=1
MAGIQTFKSRVRGDFSRPNLFQCNVSFPTGVTGGDAAASLGAFTVRAANLPATQVGVVEVPGIMTQGDEVEIFPYTEPKWIKNQ